jgi:hypothetical protein
LFNHKKAKMLKKIKGFLQRFVKNQPRRETSSEALLAQADLSERLLWSLGLAKKLGLRVYIRIDVGNRSHGISVQGKDDPTLEYLYDLANESWKACLIDANEAKSAERAKSEALELEKKEGGEWPKEWFK